MSAPVGWPALAARVRRQQRQLRVARFLLRLFRLGEVEALPIGEYAVAYGYVEGTHDLRSALSDLARWAHLANPIRSTNSSLDKAIKRANELLAGNRGNR